MADAIGRRDFLKRSSGALIAGTTGFLSGSARALAETASPDAGAAFRFAFLTDIHVRPELGAERGFRQCVAAVNALRPRVDFVITGGDLVADALAADYPRARCLWDLYENVCKDFEMPVHHAIGNHDVLGWSERSTVSPDHAHFGKRIFMDRLGDGRTYRSFDHKGWHFILLDSIGQAEGGRGYLGLIDEKQVAWLEADLESVGPRRPIVVVTHIPFFSVWRQMQYGPHANPPKQDRFYVKNARKLRTLLKRYNVRLILQGHMHVTERIEVSGQTYVTTGAVCGNQWKGPRFGEFPEGYGVVTICGGEFDYAYKTYGWKATACDPPVRRQARDLATDTA